MKRRISIILLRKKVACIFIVLASYLLAMMFYVKTTDNMDFVRIQELMESLRNTKLSLIEYLFTEAGTQLNATLRYTFLFNILMYFVAKYCENYFVLTWISAAIDFAVISYIYYDWTKTRKTTVSEMICMVFLCAAFLPFVHVVSGIRAAMAACFMALAVYKYIYRNKSILVFGFLVFLSVSSHPFTIYAIPAALLIRYSSSIKAFFIVLMGTIGLIYLVPIIGRLGIPFLSTLAIKFHTYTAASQYTSYRSIYYSSLICAVLFVLYYLLFLWKKTDKKKSSIEIQKDRLYKFIICYSAVILGSFGSYDIVCRLSYVLGAFSPVLSEMIFSLRKKDQGRYLLARVLCIIIIILAIYTFMKHIRYYGGFFRLENLAISTNPLLQK